MWKDVVIFIASGLIGAGRRTFGSEFQLEDTWHEQLLLRVLEACSYSVSWYVCNELAAELETHEVTFGTEGIADFYRAMDRAHHL